MTTLTFFPHYKAKGEAMSFMRPEVYKGEYYSVDCNSGETHIVPVSVSGHVKKNRDLADYVEGKPDYPNRKPTLEKGWIYRMQAPGYMDATDWSVADTEREAYRELLEYNGNNDGDRENDEDWEEEAKIKAGICTECGNDVPKDRTEETCSQVCWVKSVERTGPETDDFTTEDYMSFFRLNRSTGSFDTTPDNWQRDVKTIMDKEQYWPNVWYIGERGDVNLLSLETGNYALEDAKSKRA